VLIAEEIDAHPNAADEQLPRSAEPRELCATCEYAWDQRVEGYGTEALRRLVVHGDLDVFVRKLPKDIAIVRAEQAEMPDDEDDRAPPTALSGSHERFGWMTSEGRRMTE
jgi:hypothetical protein